MKAAMVIAIISLVLSGCSSGGGGRRPSPLPPPMPRGTLTPAQQAMFDHARGFYKFPAAVPPVIQYVPSHRCKTHSDWACCIDPIRNAAPPAEIASEYVYDWADGTPANLVRLAAGNAACAKWEATKGIQGELCNAVAFQQNPKTTDQWFGPCNP